MCKVYEIDHEIDYGNIKIVFSYEEAGKSKEGNTLFYIVISSWFHGRKILERKSKNVAESKDPRKYIENYAPEYTLAIASVIASTKRVLENREKVNHE